VLFHCGSLTGSKGYFEMFSDCKSGKKLRVFIIKILFCAIDCKSISISLFLPFEFHYTLLNLKIINTIKL